MKLVRLKQLAAGLASRQSEKNMLSSMYAYIICFDITGFAYNAYRDM